jgi:radical SAM/Cys-rich protein
MKSLKSQLHPLSNSLTSLDKLSFSKGMGDFKVDLEKSGLYPLSPLPLEILQINLGKMCNQVCKHCHVDAGPDRKEIMSWETMKECLSVIQNNEINTIDLTGGAPEMNPYFFEFVERIRKISSEIRIIVRCNLTIILANPKYHILPQFFRENRIEVVSSLPFYTSLKTDAQRGEGVFEKSIKALQLLNNVGYGIEGSGLILNLVYNPSGAFLPSDQNGLTQEFKRKLKQQYDIIFNDLFTITNLPISRFLDFLIKTDNLESYMEKLIQSFNPMAASNVMCRNMISVGWDGFLYDCDFNQMLDLKVNLKDHHHISHWNQHLLNSREIVVNQHCYGCTAGAGSSCGGATIA